MKYLHDWIIPDDLLALMAEHGLAELPVGTDLTYKGERFLVTNFHGGLKYTLAEWSAECEFYARRLSPYPTPATPPAEVRVRTNADDLEDDLRRPLEDLLGRVLHLNPECSEIGPGMLAHLQDLAAQIAAHLQGAACTDESGCDCESGCDA